MKNLPVILEVPRGSFLTSRDMAKSSTSSVNKNTEFLGTFKTWK